MSNVNNLRFKDLTNSTSNMNTITNQKSSVLNKNYTTGNPLIDKLNQSSNINKARTTQNSSVLNIKNTVNPLLLRLKDSDVKKISSENTKNKQKKDSWLNNFFKSSEAFSDGSWDAGDLTKTVLSSVGDWGLNVVEGYAKSAEDIGSAIAGAEAQVADWIGFDEHAKQVRERIANNGGALVSSLAQKGEDALDKNSVLDTTMDNVASGVGQSLGYYIGSKVPGLGTSISIGKKLNVPLTAVLSGIGGGLQESYQNEDIEDWQAWSKAIGSGTIEGLSEGIIGMFGVGGSELDDLLIDQVNKKIKNTIIKEGAKLGIKAGGEASEEFISYAGNYILDRIIDKATEISGTNDLRLAKDWDWNEVGEQMGTAFLSTLITQGTGDVLINKLNKQNNSSTNEKNDEGIYRYNDNNEEQESPIYGSLEQSNLEDTVGNSKNDMSEEISPIYNTNNSESIELINDIEEYTQKERKNFSTKNKILINNVNTSLEEFVNNDEYKGKRLYFGKIGQKIANKLKSKINIDLNNFNISLKKDTINDILKEYANEKEVFRGQVPVTIEDLKNIPNIIANPDNVYQNGVNKASKPVINFEKNINGKNIVVSYVSDKHQNLEIQTMYIQKNKSFVTTSNAINALDTTFKTDSDTAHINNIILQKQNYANNESNDNQVSENEKGYAITSTNNITNNNIITKNTSNKTDKYNPKEIKSGIKKDFEISGYVNLNGIQINNPKQLAEIAQIFRNPYYEITRILYFDENNILLGYDSFSAHKVNLNYAMMDTSKNSINNLKEKINQMGAKYIVHLHNHPSGNPNPSLQDLKCINSLNENNIITYGMVIDHNKYSYIENGKYNIDMINNSNTEDFILDYVGKVSSVNELAQISMNTQHKHKNIIIFTDAINNIRSIQEITDKFIKDKEKFIKYVQEQKSNTGSLKVFTSSKNSLIKPLLENYVKTGLLQDSFFDDTQTSLMQNPNIELENKKSKERNEILRKVVFEDFSTIRKKGENIKTSKNSVKYVTIDSNFFDNIPDIERPKYLMNYIKENLAGKIITTDDGTDIHILDRDDNRLGKLVYGNVAFDKRIGSHIENKLEKNQFRFELKGNIISNLEDMIKISEVSKHKADINNRHGKFAFNGFDTRKSYIYDGKDIYKVEFDVAIDNNNKHNMYAIKGVQKKNSLHTMVTSNEASYTYRKGSNTDSITQKNNKVNDLHNKIKKALPKLPNLNENSEKYSISDNENNKEQPKWIETSFKNELVRKNLNKDNLKDVKYLVQGDEQTLAKVEQKIFSQGFEECLKLIDETYERKEESKLRGSHYANFNKEEAVMAQRLIQIAIQKKQFDIAERLISQLSIAGSEHGQAIQALSLINKLSPEGQYMHVQRLVKRLNEEINRKSGLLNLKNKLDNAISTKSRKVINDHETQIEKISNIDNDFARKLAEKISNSVEPKNIQNQLGNQKLQKEIINELYKVAIESPITLEKRVKASKMNAREKLKLAIENKELYGKTWNDAKSILAKKYKGNSDILLKLENYFEKGIVPDYSIETFKKAYNEVLKEKCIKVKKSIQNNLNKEAKKKLIDLNELRPDQQKKIIKDVANTLIKEIGANKEDAKILSMQIVSEFFNELKDDNINKLVKATSKFKDIELTEEMKNKILSSENIEILENNMEEVRQELANQIPATISDKIRSWRYFSMLFNPQTHVRNVLGNMAMSIVNIPKNMIARGTEALFNDKLSERTRTFKKASQEIKDFAKEDVEKMFTTLSGENKLSMENRIMQKRRIFKKLFGKWDILEKITKFNSELLEKEDTIFLKKAYIANFSEYLTANNITTLSEIENEPELVEKARVFAIQESKKATFRQDSNLAKLLQQIEDKYGLTGQVLIGGVAPFKKTPINITKMAIDYSPIGLGWTITKRVSDLKNGKITANEFIDQISKGLTGVGIYILGVLLYTCGMITAGADDDKDDKYKQQLGWKPYAIKIGNKYYSLSWLAPSAIPLFMGAETASIVKDQNKLDFNSITESVGQALNPLMDMSMLQGVNDALSLYNADGILGNIGNATKSAGENYLLQFIPSISSKIASTFDDTKRTTTPSKNSSFKELESLGRQAMYKIPGLRNMLEPVKNVWGEDIKNGGNVIERVLENFVLPTYGSEYIETDVDKAILKLYDETGENAIIPKTQNNYITYQGIKYEMSAKEYTKYKETYGKSLNVKLKEIFNSENYNKLSNEEKLAIVKDMYTYASEEAKKEYLEAKNVDYNYSSTHLLYNLSENFFKDNTVIQNLYYQTQEKYALPVDSLNNFTYQNVKFKVTQKEKEAYAEASYKILSKLYQKLNNNSKFKNMSNENKLKILQEVRSKYLNDLKKQYRVQVIKRAIKNKEYEIKK